MASDLLQCNPYSIHLKYSSHTWIPKGWSLIFMSSFAYLHERVNVMLGYVDRKFWRSSEKFAKENSILYGNQTLTSLLEPPSATRTCIHLLPPGKRIDFLHCVECVNAFYLNNNWVKHANWMQKSVTVEILKEWLHGIKDAMVQPWNTGLGLLFCVSA